MPERNEVNEACDRVVDASNRIIRCKLHPKADLCYTEFSSGPYAGTVSCADCALGRTPSRRSTDSGLKLRITDERLGEIAQSVYNLIEHGNPYDPTRSWNEAVAILRKLLEGARG
jgi:hypothetical protein